MGVGKTRTRLKRMGARHKDDDGSEFENEVLLSYGDEDEVGL